MIYYIVILCLLTFSVLIQFKLRQDDIKTLSLGCFWIILIIGGLRYQIGADWYAYERLFSNIENFNDILTVREEKGFMLTMFLIKGISKNYSFFIFSFFLVSFYLKYKVITKYSTDTFLSLSFYFFTIFLILDLNQIRQGMALAFIIFSLDSILNRDIKKFLFLVLIAFFFHTSALIFLPFYWLARLNINNKTIVVIIASCFILSIPIREFMGKNIMANLLISWGELGKYNVYLEDSSLNKDSAILSIGFFQRIIVFAIFLVYYNTINVSDNFKRLLRNGYLIGINIFIIFSFNAQFAARIGYYYKWFDIFIVALIVTSQKKIEKKLILLFVFYIFCIIGIQRLLGNDGGALLPYKMCLW